MWKRIVLWVMCGTLVACAGGTGRRDTGHAGETPVQFANADGSAAVAGIEAKNVLTREELRACFEQDREIKRSHRELDQVRLDLQNEDTALQVQDSELAVRRQRVDQYSKASVDEFNQWVLKNRQAINDHNKRVEAHRAAAKKSNAVVEAFNRGCAGRLYYPSDLQAIKEGRPELFQDAAAGKIHLKGTSERTTP